jgi:hypothetical protein
VSGLWARRLRIVAQYSRVSCLVALLYCGASLPAMKQCLSLLLRT